MERMLNPDMIRQRTAEARPQVLGANAPTKAHAIATIIANSDFGCQTANVKKLVEAITGEKLPRVRGKKREFSVGAVVTQNDKQFLVRSLDSDGDAHVLGADLVIEVNGTSFLGKSTNWTVATEEEVESFLTAAGLV
jgi:hypothetical protein